MPDSPISASPYEVLGVAASASDDDLRRAYRRLLRATHPDLGGDATRFVAVQRAWERVGTPGDRAVYDRGGHSRTDESHSFAQSSRDSRQHDSRPRARAYGHPGGWRRERYLGLLREWVGRGSAIDDPYNPALVRSAPREIRRILADALAEEATATALADLGIGWTIWHDVATGAPDEKIDHIALGPTGLFALLSEDYGDSVTVKRGELAGPAIGDGRPMHELGQRARTLTRSLRIRFTALVIVVPDDALDEPLADLGRLRGSAAIALRQSYVAGFLRAGLPDLDVVDGPQLFDVRTKLQSGIRFV